MKINRFTYCLLLVAITAVTISSCSGCSSKNEPNIKLCKVLCDESFKDILEEEIQVFEYRNDDIGACVLPHYTDETSAFDSLLMNKSNLIITYRDLTDEEKEILRKQGRGCHSLPIAVDAVALIVNKDNDVENLSMNDIRDILTGKKTKWGELNSSVQPDKPIKVVFDRNGSGAVHYIKDKFNNGQNFPIEVFAQNNTEALIDLVDKDRTAIGIIGVSRIDPNDMLIKKQSDQEQSADTDKNYMNIKVLGVKKDDSNTYYKPYQQNIYDGNYPLYRVVYAINASALGTLENKFYVFITGTIGQKIMLHTGVSPYRIDDRVIYLK
ncbi:MAG: substrate-binding domain-containing protein [Muribaculaceae bacterium]|nr:substrate-binding domain-containing protein [Muribaculaceae bacterium]